MTVTDLEPYEVWCSLMKRMVEMHGKVELASLPRLHIESCREQKVCKHYGKFDCKVGKVLEGKW